MARPTYRQWLQGIVNGSVSPVGGMNKQEASALLQVVGDDGGVDARFVGDSYGFTGDDRGQVFSTTAGKGENTGYGPQSLIGVNNTYANLYNQEYPAPAGGGGGGDGGAAARAAAKEAEENARRGALRGDIKGKANSVEEAYAGLFGDLNNLVTARDSELETQYGDQFKKAGESYAAAIPEIEMSYAALGAGDSTNVRDANIKAKKGFDDTTETIGANKSKDKAALGQYKTENEAKFSTDRDAARRNISQADSTTDIGALESSRGGLDTNIDATKVTRATLGTDGSARDAVTNLTKDGGRYESAINALDSIIQSSLSGSVKEAAVKAISDNAGLSDEEKKKVDAQYGNVYAEQQAL